MWLWEASRVLSQLGNKRQTGPPGPTPAFCPHFTVGHSHLLPAFCSPRTVLVSKKLGYMLIENNSKITTHVYVSLMSHLVRVQERLQAGSRP